MKQLYLFFLFCFLSELSYAQISITYTTPNDTRPPQIVKKKDGNYWVVINQMDRTLRPIASFAKIFEMNARGAFVDSVIIKKKNQSFTTNRLIPVSDGFITLGSLTNDSDNQAFFTATRFDKHLRAIQDTLLPISGIENFPAFAVDQDSTIIFNQRGSDRDNYFGKMDKNGTIKFWKRDSSLSGFIGHTLIVRKDSLLYTIFLTYQFITLDTAFNKKHESQGIRDNIGISTNIVPLTDSTVCIAGKAYSGNGWRHFFGIKKLTGEAIFTNLYSMSRDTPIWGASVNCIDTTKLGEWYWGGTYNYNAFAGGIDLSSSYFLLHKLNKNYSTKWTKKYGGDAYYEMYGVLAKDDGGCLMYGTRYDYNNTPKFDAYILNVDAEGVITSESSIPLNMPTITAYPNPGNGQLSFKVPPSVFGQIDLAVFDISGKLVYQKKEAALSETFDLSNLPNGNYLYQIFQDGTPLSVGKWQKIGN